jgi:hypothetical protein
MLLVQTRGTVRLASGHALSTDGLWRQHSWGVVAEDGRIVETTERRVCYYGIVLSNAETVLRLLGMIESGELWPEEVEEVRESILKFYQLPAGLVGGVDRLRAERMGSQ